MRDILDSGPARAGLFFAAALLVSTAMGALFGDLRQGLATGTVAGIAMAAFGYLFVRPA